jgi:hypothetical protein
MLMNQILSVNSDNDRKKNRKSGGGPIEIMKVARFFAVVLVIFGVFLIGTGSYAIYKENKDVVEVATSPEITREYKDERTLLIKIMHDKNIATVTYRWNDDAENVIEGNQRKYIEQVIQIPGGVNTLEIVATDENGQSQTYEETFEYDDGIVVEQIENSNNLKVSGEFDKQISFMTYRWDDDEETTISDIDSKVLNEQIEIPKGQHTLTIVIVFSNNEQITKIQEVKGVTAPTIEVTVDPNYENITIDVTDEEGLDKIEITLVGESEEENVMQRLIAEDNQTEIVYTIPVQEGENKLEIKAYNVNGITTTEKKKLNR